jgi:exonuclease SbcC
MKKRKKKYGTGEVLMIGEVKLVNIKSYSDQLIRFTEGVNAIIGENGAGKTTILEAIGFALFDSLPYKIGDFLRKGEKKGEIRVRVTGNDGRVYEVVRKISNAGTQEYYVSDPETVRVAEGTEEVAEWIKENFGLSVDAKTMFENAVGVSQGKLTSQFLESPSVRDRIFSPILRVEGYKKAFERSREYENFIKERINETERKIAVLQKEVEIKKKLEKKQSELAEQKSRLITHLRKIDKEIEPVKRKLEKFDEVFSKLKSLEVKEAQVLAQIEGLKREIAQAEKELEDLKNAEKELEDLKDSYMNYVEAEEKLSGLELEKAKLEKSIEGLRELSINFEKIKIEIENIKERLTEIENKEKELKSIEPLAEKEQMLKDELKNIEIAEKNLETIKTQISSLRDEIEEKKIELDKFEEKESRLKELELKHEKILDVEEKRDSLLKAISGLKAQIEVRKREYEQLKGSICPILREECNRIVSVRDSKRKELEDALHKLRDFIEKYEKVKKVAEKRKELEGEINKLRGEIKTVKRITVEIEAKKKNLEELVEKAGKLEEVVARKEEVLTNLDSVEGYLEKKAVIIQIISQKESFIEKLNSKKAEKELIAGKVAILPEVERELEEIGRKISGLRVVTERNKTGFQQYLQLKDRVSRKEKIVESFEVLKKQRKELDGKHSTISKVLAELKSGYNEKDHENLRVLLQKLIGRRGEAEGSLKSIEKSLLEIKDELEEAGRKEEELVNLKSEKERLDKKYKFIRDLREIFKIAIPEITKAYVESVSIEANRIFCELMNDYGWELHWTEDFGIKAKYLGREIDFAQMSGGEQMCAALAVRLALLKVLSDISLAFFDEPTQNMDELRRRNLASQLSKVDGFRQIFVISHDDTFEEMVENAVKVRKANNVSTVEI